MQKIAIVTTMVIASHIHSLRPISTGTSQHAVARTAPRKTILRIRGKSDVERSLNAGASVAVMGVDPS